MINKPKFRPHYRAVTIPDEGVLLLGENDSRIIRSKQQAQIAELIDGNRSSDEIAGLASEHMDAAIAWSILLKLEKSGLIEEAGSHEIPENAAFWFSLGAAPPVPGSGIRVFAETDGLAGTMEASLRRFGINPVVAGSLQEIGPAANSDGLDVILARDYLDDQLLEIADMQRNSDRRWLLARPFGTNIWVGPLFGPDAGCMHCLNRRMAALSPAQLLAAKFDPSNGMTPPLGIVPGSRDIACGIVAAETAKIMAGADSDLGGAIREISIQDWSSRLHRVVTIPPCKACGGLPVRENGPLQLKADPIRFSADGGYRTVTPEETLQHYDHLVSPLGGIVARLTPKEGNAEIGVTCIAEEFGRQRPEKLAHLVAAFRVTNMGKGRTLPQATAGALCEAIERYSLLPQGTESLQQGSLNELADSAIHPNAVMGYSEVQYRDRVEWNKRHKSYFHFVPDRFDPDRVTDWVAVWSLTKQQFRLLPYELLYFSPVPEGVARTCASCSNGCASGNTIEEAILQGFLELAERDAIAMWWYNRLRRPAVELDAFDDEWFAALVPTYRSLNREIVLLDITNDLGIPVYAAISWRTDGPPERICIGFGCHFDARLAAQRAATEIVQMLSIDLVGDTEAMRQFADGWLETVTRANNPYLDPVGTTKPSSAAGHPMPGQGTIAGCIDWCRRTVESRGMEMMVHDLTRPDAGMPVAKVIVPGLRHFWSRYAPGRLYDVPVALGWTDTPTEEADLNPIPFFF